MTSEGLKEFGAIFLAICTLVGLWFGAKNMEFTMPPNPHYEREARCAAAGGVYEFHGRSNNLNGHCLKEIPL